MKYYFHTPLGDVWLRGENGGEKSNLNSLLISIVSLTKYIRI